MPPGAVPSKRRSVPQEETVESIPKVEEGSLEWTLMLHRKWFGMGAMLLFAITIIAGSIVAGFGGDAAWQRMNALLQIVVPVVTLIIGAMSAYYFGEK